MGDSLAAGAEQPIAERVYSRGERTHFGLILVRLRFQLASDPRESLSEIRVVAGVYLNSEERQDACPLGRAFCIGKLSWRGRRLTLRPCGAWHCKLAQHVSRCSRGGTVSQSSVNLRYSDGFMHIALSE